MHGSMTMLTLESDFVFSVGGSVQLIPHLELISDLCSSQAFRTRIIGNFDHDDNEDEDNNYDDPTCNRKFVQKPTVLGTRQKFESSGWPSTDLLIATKTAMREFEP